MPIIQGKNANCPTDEFTIWRLAEFKAGQNNVTIGHFHDCDEFVFMISGRMVMRSEGIDYTLEPRDLQVARMGNEHEILEILEDTTCFWVEGPLRGKKLRGHLRRGEETQA